MVSFLEEGIQVNNVFAGELGATLPRQGTKLLQCLEALASLGVATTGEVARKLGGKWDSNETASFLTVLRHRGLCDVVVSAKGVTGGSQWTITASAIRLLG